ncbi:ATP-binding cassette domain-containing protein [Streptomyces nodosus]|uniref:ATP-binding cassette domain-containing protein n=1 Tax=Streptomyces nodosus TaxID=40318 RepID=UPI00381A33E8
MTLQETTPEAGDASGPKPAILSGGQRRRLDVALGIVGRPELLFLDEPTTGFDPEARRDFHDLIRGLRDNLGTTMLLTTHDMTEAQQLADRIGILQHGRITACGTLAELAAVARARSEVPGRMPTAFRNDGSPPTCRTSSGNCTSSSKDRSPTWRYAVRRWRTPVCGWSRRATRTP